MVQSIQITLNPQNPQVFDFSETNLTNSFYLPHDQENENMYGVEEEPIIVLKPLTVKKLDVPDE